MSFYGIKITSADRWFSLFIRFRDSWTCRACGKYCMRRKLNNPDLPTMKIETAHIFSRKHKNLRHDPLNALSLCFSCHQKFSSDETKWVKFVVAIIGADVYNQLTILKYTANPHWMRLSDKEIAKMYREKVTLMAAQQGKLWIIGK